MSRATTSSEAMQDGPAAELTAALASCRGAFLATGLISGMSNVLMLTGAIFMLEIYDRVLPSRSVPSLIGIAVLAAALYVALGFLDLIRGRILARIGISLDEALSGRLYQTIVRLPSIVGLRNDGAAPMRDLDTVRAFLGGIGPVALFDLPWIPVYLGICFAFHFLIGITATIGAFDSDHSDPPDRMARAQADKNGGQAGAIAQYHTRVEPAQFRNSGRHGHGPASHRALEQGQCGLSCEQQARERRRRRLWRNLQGPAADAAVGRARSWRLPRHPSRGLGWNHHRRLDPQCPGSRACRHCHLPLARLCGGETELGSAAEVAGDGPAGNRADAAAAAAQEPRCRERERGAAGRTKAGGARPVVEAPARQRPRRDRPQRFRQVVARPHAGRILGAQAGQGLP